MNSSIEEVIHTLVEALVIVTLVVFVFSGVDPLGADPGHRHSPVVDRHLRDDGGLRLFINLLTC